MGQVLFGPVSVRTLVCVRDDGYELKSHSYQIDIRYKTPFSVLF